MADQLSISPADLRYVENRLSAISSNIEAIDGNIDTLNTNITVVYDQLGALAQDFADYVLKADMQHELEIAQIRLVEIRQELEKEFGHYDEVRRTTTGILQADDLGIVQKQTITSSTEELMLSTPNYWLAPCLVALAAWISNQPDIAEKALMEGIRQDEEKTYLLFGLICRRAGRKHSSLKWIRNYLETQDPENLDWKCIVVLDAFASGLLGVDSEGIVSKLMGEWLEYLGEKIGFVEQQTQQWSDAINQKRRPLGQNEYHYLRQHSPTWPALEYIMEGARLHADIYGYYTSIFQQEFSTDSVKQQLDGILTSLVSDFDEEELPLREDEKLTQFIVQYKGDVNRATNAMAVEQTAFEVKKDFTQLLTDAAMKPESSHASPSTQKFAIALSRDWIRTAYGDIVAQNRAQIPNQIDMDIGGFVASTTDGQNEQDLQYRLNSQIDQEKANALQQVTMNGFDQFCLYGGGTIAAIGVFMLFMGNILFALIALIAGIGLVIRHFSRKKQVQNQRDNLEDQFEQRRERSIGILRAILAEVVDFRREFDARENESQHVVDFLNQLSPDQYVRNLSTSSRRIKVND